MTQMDMSTVTFLAGVISCIIGLSTFITGRMSKAEQNGTMEQKINQALEGIASINRKLEQSTNEQHNMELLVRSHDEQIKTLFRTTTDLRSAIEDGERTREILAELLQTMKSK